MRHWIGKLTVITNRPEPPIAVVVEASAAASAATRAMRSGVAKWKRTGNKKRVVEYHLVLKPGAKIAPEQLAASVLEEPLAGLRALTTALSQAQA